MECNNFVFNDKILIQSDGTAQGPHMPYSYSDNMLWRILTMQTTTTVWQHFREDIFSVRTQNIDTLPAFLDLTT